MTKNIHCEPVKLNLVGLDGNAFAVMGAWRRAAKKAKRTSAEIDAVLADCMSGDYNHLLNVISMHSK
jgi:hypothetical protein